MNDDVRVNKERRETMNREQGREPIRESIREPINDERSVERAADAERPTPLFHEQELTGYRTRWGGIQTGFVDEPRKAVEEADALVSELTSRLAQSFTDERRRLEERWGKAENVSTEDLRQAMRRYRSFFERLLTI
jgi:hypothetical protein